LQSTQTTPLQISGNTTADQRELLQQTLAEAVERICRTALKSLDRQSIQLVLELDEKLKAELASLGSKLIERLARSEKYKDEETVSYREYPPAYSVRPIEAQVTELKKAFPGLGKCIEKLARRPLPQEAEGWFAIPRWQAIAPTYNQAVQTAMKALTAKRRISNRIADKLGPAHLRQNERTKRADEILQEQQPGADILVVAAQAGLRHRGCSARRARAVMSGHEFGLGSFALCCMLITHPERLSHADALMLDCSGDEYSLHADKMFDRVPLFDYDIGGIEFSVFHEDRARNLWGTPTAFTVNFAEQKEPHMIASAIRPQSLLP